MASMDRAQRPGALRGRSGAASGTGQAAGLQELRSVDPESTVALADVGQHDPVHRLDRDAARSAGRGRVSGRHPLSHRRTVRTLHPIIAFPPPQDSARANDLCERIFHARIESAAPGFAQQLFQAPPHIRAGCPVASPDCPHFGRIGGGRQMTPAAPVEPIRIPVPPGASTEVLPRNFGEVRGSPGRRRRSARRRRAAPSGMGTTAGPVTGRPPAPSRRADTEIGRAHV